MKGIRVSLGQLVFLSIFLTVALFAAYQAIRVFPDHGEAYYRKDGFDVLIADWVYGKRTTDLQTILRTEGWDKVSKGMTEGGSECRVDVGSETYDLSCFTGKPGEIRETVVDPGDIVRRLEMIRGMEPRIGSAYVPPGIVVRA